MIEAFGGKGGERAIDCLLNLFIVNQCSIIE